MIMIMIMHYYHVLLIQCTSGPDLSTDLADDWFRFPAIICIVHICIVLMMCSNYHLISISLFMHDHDHDHDHEHYLIIVQSAICTRGVDFNTHQCLSYYHATANAIAMTTSLPV